MEAASPPKRHPKKRHTVLIHLKEVDYKRTLAAADHDGLQTGPWLRMHLLKILRDLDHQGNGQ